MVALVLFAISVIYLFESGFSPLLAIKTNQRNRLDAKDDIHVALSKIIPQFRVIVENKQQQFLH